MITDYLNLSIKNLMERKMRAFLTVLGIIIGVAAIVSLYSLGEGLENSIKQQFSSFGSDILIVVPKGLRGPPIGAQGLTTKDFDIVKEFPELAEAYPLLFLKTDVKFNNDEQSLLIRGFPTDVSDIEIYKFGRTLKEGSLLEDKGKFSAMIGAKLATDDVFGKEVRLHNKIEVHGKEFRVVGIVNEVGNQDIDSLIYIPIDAAREVFEKPEEVSVIVTVVKDTSTMQTLRERILRKLENARNDEDVATITPDEIQGQINQVLGAVKIFLVGIAAISIIVGAIGILNAMYTAVLERTNEIGVMKSIGAKNSNILSMFLIESAAIGFIGGLIGVIVGFSLAFLVQFFAKLAGFALLKVEITLPLILFGIGFAVLIGVISGTMPAIRASRLNPIEALRYE